MSLTPMYSTKVAMTPLGQRKVAIPRLQKPGLGQTATKDRRRVPRACTACRSHKIKCTGERPQCKHCATTSRECVYIMPRKDRLKIVNERCQQMASLLKGLQSCANADDAGRISELLEAVEEEISEARHTTASSIPDTDANGSQEDHDFNVLNHQSELDTDSLDLLDEDLHISDRARATGFVGKNSEVQWLRAAALAQNDRLEDEPGGQRRGSFAPSATNEQISSYSFWSDVDSVDIDFFVDPYDLPQLETAERLLGSYMNKVHDSFPILPRKTFEDQFRKYFTALSNGNAPRLSPKWQAILNLVFAIGAKYSHLSKASWQADARDHLIYQARARAFGLNESTMTVHPDVPQIQSLGLLAFYWLSVGQISRAWTVIGMAVRFAYTLGLHVRNEDPSATAVKRETLVRTWWSLYSLERTLSIITGRPSIIVDSCCSVPLPMPVIEEQISDRTEATFRRRMGSTPGLVSTSRGWSSGSIDSPRTPVGLGTTEANSGSYFRAAVQLSIITQSILTSLYTASTIIRSPAENQHEMAQLSQRLDQWVLALPRELNFQDPGNGASMMFSRERILLGFQLCSARMLLGRPCLNHRRQAWREGSEATFARRMGNSCIEAAKTVVDFLPEEPNAQFIYDQGPWWCIVHHLMQAVSVVLLGLSYPASTSEDSVLLMHYVKKVVRWLSVMQDPVAERAYQVAVSTFESVSRRHTVSVAGMWKAEPVHAAGVHLPVDPSIAPYVPLQYAPHDSVATYAAYDPVSAGTAFPAYNGTAVFAENYHMGR
ncbi:C6 transcription factor [Stagonosporopsis vannaccii]|nr:C6 transcription factor [Stagonosporopsis vannaccii]